MFRTPVSFHRTPVALGPWLMSGLLAACTAPAAVETPPPLAGAIAPWPLPPNEGELIKKAGMDDLTTGERRNVSWTIHLDVFKDGVPVVIPGNVGIDFSAGFSAPVHTHLRDGVVWVESPVVRPFTLGPFFTMWDVPLAGAAVYLNGTQVPDPGALVLADRQQIAVVFGSPPASIPSTFPTTFGPPGGTMK